MKVANTKNVSFGAKASVISNVQNIGESIVSRIQAGAENIGKDSFLHKINIGKENIKVSVDWNLKTIGETDIQRDPSKPLNVRSILETIKNIVESFSKN